MTLAWYMRMIQHSEEAGALSHSTGESLLEKCELFVKPDDRWEVNDVVQHHLELAEGLERTLRGFVEAAGRVGPLEAPALPALDASPDVGEPETA